MIQTAATLDDLMRFDGKAELISGRIIPIVSCGYFTAGTEIVWDVDPEAEIIAAYRAGDPATRSCIASAI